MSKILGDNPFDDDESPTLVKTPPDEDEQPERKRASTSDETSELAVVPLEPVDPVDPIDRMDLLDRPERLPSVDPEAPPLEIEPEIEIEIERSTAAAPSRDDDEADEWSDESVPDAVPWPIGRAVIEGGDVFLGGESAIPPGEYGTRARSRRDEVAEAEMRELERRVDAQRTPAFPLDARQRVGMGFLWKRWRQIAMLGRSDVVDDFGRDPRATARWEPLIEFLYSRWFRVEAAGLEHIPENGPALLVANHAGTLPYDSAMVMHAVRRDHATRRDVRPLVEDAVFHLPWLGPLINRIGGVRACPENAERLLARGEVVAVFPEGTKGMGKLWRDRYRLQRFGRGGFVKLALRTGAPLIPVAVVGAEEATPMFAKVTWFAKSIGIPWVPVTPTFPWLGAAGLLPLPSKWLIRFGEPIDLGEHDPDAANDRLLVGRLAESVRAGIQEMVDDLRNRRRSPFG